VPTEAFIPAGQPILSGAKNNTTGERALAILAPTARLRLVYIEPQPDRSTAMRRERVLKALKHHQKKALIIRNAQP
jgi:predicted GIY-YIG superfamily endonuclease